MAQLFKSYIRISLIKIVTIVVLLIILILLYFYVIGAPDTKLNTIFGGLISGFIVALGQLFLGWYEYKNIDKLKQMKIKDIRSDRAARDFYEQLIRSSERNIDVMGVTAERFMNDFADTKSSNKNMRVLLTAMSRGVKVRILIPHESYLESENQRRSAQNVKSKLESVKADFNSNFDFRFFGHLPTHSIFVADDTCILGPVFPEVQSKDTPAIFLENTSPYAIKYLKYYEDEWNKAGE